MMTKSEKHAYLSRLDAAARDWADSRALTVEMTPVEGSDGVIFELAGAIEAVWSPRFDESDLWGFLDDSLDEARPAGQRSLPEGLTRIELENKAEALTYKTPFAVDFFRTNTREFRVTLVDVVTRQAEANTLYWRPETTKEQLLAHLDDLIEDKLDQVRDQLLTPDEHRMLSQLSPHQIPAKAEREFLGDLPLNHWLGEALAGSLLAHWKLRQVIEAMRPRPKPPTDYSIN